MIIGRRSVIAVVLSALVALPAVAGDVPGSDASAPAASGAAPSASLESVLAPLTKDRLFTVSHVGVQIVDLTTGEEVFARGGDDRMIPASTNKVITAAVALRTIGPAYRYTTDIYVQDDKKPAGDGVLDSDVFIQGHGDPTFVVETLWRVVHDLKMQGITKIDGDLVFDESYLDQNYRITGWDKTEDIESGPSYFAPTGALSLNYNSVGLVVGPGTAVGKEARVELDTPCGDYVEIDNKVVTGAVGTRRSIRITREVEDDDTMKFTLTGSVPADGDTDTYYRSVEDPTAFFMGAFVWMLNDQGITLSGDAVRGTVPADADLIVQHRSEELTEILMDMNKTSNNFMAETVLKTVGAETGGLPGSTAKGVAAIGSYLNGLGIDSSEFKILNGSGLSRDSRVKPSTFDAVLLDMANDPRVGHEFISSLSIAGRDGTLWRRLSEEPGRLRGKTGTIDGVHGLVGYLEGNDGHEYAFAFLVNDIHGDSSQVKRLQDKFARAIFAAGANGPEVVEGGAGGDEGGDDPQ